MRSILLIACLLLSACGEPVRDATPVNEAEADPAPSPSVVTERQPVRVGELGANFDACNAAGTTRHIAPGQALAVRAAPFDSAAESGGVPAGGRFFVCTRSLDQKWFGIVYDQAGALDEACGVSRPVASRRNYEGPCRSGWVASAFVKLISGIEPAPAQVAPGNSTQPST
jgi:hypothetical protein